MKKIFVRSLHSVSWIAVVAMLSLACQDDTDDNSSATQEQRKEHAAVSARDNTEIIAATQEVMDITDDAMTEEGVAGGRKGRPKWNCRPSITSSITTDNSNIDSVIIYSGTLTIDYGDGSSCEDSTHIRRGKIISSFECIVTTGDSVRVIKTQTITFEGFYKDSIQLDGTFTTTHSTRDSSVLEIDNARLTYADDSTLSWSGTLTFVSGEKNEDNDNEGHGHSWGNRTLTITGSITGTTREGLTFSSDITEGVVYAYSCSGGFGHKNFPVSGTINITTDGTLSVVDYGDGTCDKVYTVTTNGETTEHTFEKKHRS